MSSPARCLEPVRRILAKHYVHRNQILKQPFAARKFAQADSGGQLAAGCGAHKDGRRWIGDRRLGEGGEPPDLDPVAKRMLHWCRRDHAVSIRWPACAGTAKPP